MFLVNFVCDFVERRGENHICKYACAHNYRHIDVYVEPLPAYV